MQPAMLLADEPTGNLDRATGEEVMHLLEALNQQGVTLIVTICVLVANFTVDILIGFLDPRVKAGLQMGGN